LWRIVLFVNNLFNCLYYIMGWIRLRISDEVEREFRIKVAELGGKKGDLSRYFEEAVKEWVKKKREQQ